MATVATSTQADALAFPHTPSIVRDMSTRSSAGYLFVVIRTGTDTLTVFRSIDNGGAWGTAGAFTHTGLQEWSSLVIDKSGNGHLMYRIGTDLGATGVDSIYYRRYGVDALAWGSAILMADDPNAGTIGSKLNGIELAVYRSGSGYYLPFVLGYATSSGGYGAIMGCGRMKLDGTNCVQSHDTVSNNRYWHSSTYASGRYGPSLEVEHNGDGFTASPPHLWMCFGRTRLRLVRCGWNGSGWTGPSNPTSISDTLGAHDYTPGRWDGQRFLMAVINPADTTTVRVYQRNQSNSSTTTLVATPTHPTGVVTDLAITYDNGNKDVRVLAVGTSTDVLYHVTYTRFTGTWGAWSTVVATAVLNSGREFGVRRGGTAGNARVDILTAHTGSPNTIVHTQQTVTSAPNIATWELSGKPYVNGGAADVATTLLLDWTFSDPDPGQSQGTYALSRQIGVAAIQYFTAAGATWGGTEVQNSTATTQVTLATAWGADGDANHTYRVKVWDNVATPAADYSTALTLIPSAKVNPAITSPTAAQVIGTDHLTVTWTAAEQSSRRIRLLSDPGSLVVYDSGFVSTADLDFVIPYVLGNISGWTVELTTKNNEGLSSTAQTRNFTVSYIAPPATISTFVPSPSLGYITITPVAAAPVGSQPVITNQDLYRRAAVTPVLNANPSMAGNVTGWFIGGGGTPGTLTYSTVQFHDSPGAARYVPNAAGSTEPTVEQTTSYVVTPGLLYRGSAWIRPDTANKPLKIQLNWWTIADALVTGSFNQILVPVALAWHYIEVYAEIPATAAKVSVAVGERSTPVAVDAFYADEVQLRAYNPETGIRVAVSADGPVNDSGPASGVEYEYQWVSTGANGTSIYGPWTT